MRSKIKFQPPVKGGRISTYTALDSQIRHAIERDAMRHGVSKSWVAKVILAAHYKIKTDVY